MSRISEFIELRSLFLFTFSKAEDINSTNVHWDSKQEFSTKAKNPKQLKNVSKIMHAL